MESGLTMFFLICGLLYYFAFLMFLVTRFCLDLVFFERTSFWDVLFVGVLYGCNFGDSKINFCFTFMYVH